MNGHRTRRGPRSHSAAHAKFRRAAQAKRWMRDNPTNAEIIAMLEEYQRDLEEEIAHVVERIRRLQEDAVDA